MALSALSDLPEEMPEASASTCHCPPLQIPSLAQDASSPFLDTLAKDASAKRFNTDGSHSARLSAVSGSLNEELDGLIEDKSISDIVNTDLIRFYADNFHEYELGRALPVVKGPLKAHIDFWVNISAPHWVLNTISSGYIIPFSFLPTSVQLSNNTLDRENNGFVSRAILDLLNLGLIVEAFSPPTVVNPLSVSFNSQGSPRLILDLRQVNQHIPIG